MPPLPVTTRVLPVFNTRSADSASGFRPPNVLVELQFESQSARAPTKSGDHVRRPPRLITVVECVAHQCTEKEQFLEWPLPALQVVLQL